jgi:16S rRNA (adenine1518-N6/adenine1519-N6)-dimethyltransferase
VSVSELLRAHGLRPKKSFGQNFLVDVHAAETIARTATEVTGGTVLELGAGLGALTRPLLARAARVLAVERDRDLVPILNAELAAPIASGALEVIEADAARLDWREALSRGPAPHSVAGNLPYLITGRLLERATEIARSIDRAVFMVQAEVADRLIAPPDGDAYGALSVFVQAAFDVRRVLTVRAGAFFPRPEVGAAVGLL